MARYAILSDIHGNLEALEAVLGDISGEKIDSFISLGDIIGYGANPKECIDMVAALEPKVMIAGNHEWGVSGRLDISYFNEDAAQAILWTRSVLDSKYISKINLFKTVFMLGGLTLVHGSLDDPAAFNYILDCHEAERSMALLTGNICFIGHSHQPEIFISEGSSCIISKHDKISIEQKKKYIINAGSIGQPRDGDPRAAYAIYDDRAGFVQIKRVKYDIQAAQGKILRSGMPASLALRLAAGR